jgi:hypothetical protein
LFSLIPLSNEIFSVTKSVGIPIYMESPTTISKRHTQLFSEDASSSNGHSSDRH